MALVSKNEFSHCCSVTGNRKGLADLVPEAWAAGKLNVAFVALLLLGRTRECMQLLVEARRWVLLVALLLPGKHCTHTHAAAGGGALVE